MASIIKADVWQNTAGIAYGTILQVVSTLKTDSFSTTSGTYVDVPGLTVTITPRFPTSKILVMANVPGGRVGAGGDAFVRLLRNGSTPVGNGTYGAFGSYAGQYGLDTKMSSRTFIDTPNTTSATTYNVQTLTASGETIFIGTRRIGDFIVGCDITVMEIAA